MLLWTEVYFCWWDAGVINEALKHEFHSQLNAEAKQQSEGGNN